MCVSENEIGPGPQAVAETARWNSVGEDMTVHRKKGPPMGQDVYHVVFVLCRSAFTRFYTTLHQPREDLGNNRI